MSRRISLPTVALAAVLCLASPPVSAQFSFKTGIDVAAFGVSVLSREGDAITGLCGGRAAAAHRVAVRHQREHGEGPRVLAQRRDPLSEYLPQGRGFHPRRIFGRRTGWSLHASGVRAAR